MPLTACGVGAVLYLFTTTMGFVVEDRLRRVMGERRMKKTIQQLDSPILPHPGPREELRALVKVGAASVPRAGEA